MSESVYRAYLNRFNGDGAFLSDVIIDLCARAGLAQELVDVSRIIAGPGGDQPEPTVRGYVVARPTTAAACLEQLCTAFNVMACETDGVIRFSYRIPQDATPLLVIPEDMLAPASNQDDDSYWKQSRRQEAEMPWTVRVRYLDRDQDYQQSMQMFQRISAPVATMQSRTVDDRELPIVFNADEARRLSQDLLVTTWTERDSFQTTLPWRYAALDPTDFVGFQFDSGTLYEVLLTKATLGADLSIAAEAVNRDEYSVGSFLTGGTADGFPVKVIRNPTQARLVLLDIPLLQDGDDLARTESRYYFAAAPYTAGWTSGLLQVSSDGENFSDVENVPGPAEFGFALTTLPAVADPWVMDTTTEFVVMMSDSVEAELSSTTFENLMAKANALLVGSEIIQFQTAELISAGTYKLTNLLRGRRGTDWAVGTHQAGEEVYVLDTDGISASSMPLSAVGAARFYRLVTFGTFPEDAEIVSFTNTGNDLRPYAPVGHAREDVEGDVEVTWLRRTRINGSFVDGTSDVPLNEDAEAYEAYVLAEPFSLETFDATDSATYVRAFTGLTTSSFTYTVAQMAADTFNPSTDTLHLVVFQLSAQVGRGFPGAASLPPL